MRVDPDLWPLTTRVDVEGRLCVGGVALNEVADQYGTPAYILDEADFRYRIRRYRATLPGVRITYAGKALLTKQVARWVADEGLGLDVCSPAELATGLAGGVDPRNIVVHGNAKTTGELRAAADAGVGRIVIDCGTEIALLASQLRHPQEVLIRVAPGIDIHGHAAVTTGIVDQKFGFAVAEGQAALAVRRVLDQPLLRLAGLHCHLGSQVTDPAPYGEAIQRMVSLMADVRNHYGVVLTELNIGGGHGVPYVTGDAELDLEKLARVIDDALDQACATERFPRPKVAVEPGRAIAARAGVTCYRVVSVKHRPGGRTFVAVDGGMGDNPRVALYGARYTVTSSPTTCSCPPTCIPVTCWPWPAPAPTTTAWRRRSTWSDARPWWRSTTDGSASWFGVRRRPTCSSVIWDERLREDAKIGLTYSCRRGSASR
jgi:diaminopimelate decarboxylase